MMRALISRIAAVAVGAVAMWLAAALGVQVTPDAVAVLTEGVTLLGMGLWLTVYAVAHKLIDRRVNPLDAAAP
jgi:hypothetical protein